MRVFMKQPPCISREEEVPKESLPRSLIFDNQNDVAKLRELHFFLLYGTVYWDRTSGLLDVDQELYR